MKSKLLSKRVLVLFILLLGFSPLSQAFAQFGITGTVTDWARNPIIGATVVIQGTNIGTTTDLDGHYTIYAIPGDTLIFSYLGMKTLKVGVRSFGSVINVVLQDDSFNFEISQNDPVINEPTIEYKAIGPWHTRLYYIEKSPRIRVTPSNKSLNLRIV
ncbi:MULTISPECIES: carboxypeptidase-like regulatory domain-containing protein [Butyricimonas]|uniref:carboxypeptidase-like regulatory domain-containing protein n=1 Tax=Butyricimonas TaxID=574697 RepID=UPI00207FFFA5|nr:carboxypeptidase-like regulatory domain-containing protein [Butyricimonas paravirosa]BDF52910.1 hypothetical protein CE91St21_03450 [Odoribacteraceae bacterium]GKH91849.1 hypothetical protein CE91St23_03450 [Odoribacteraceae bacterium]GKH96467.1 hypothetical protein CE91St22_03450 [Odoribacteraceae bacterium]GKI03346.1 hypothetical protein CE91St24_26210 [Odoribacteraceae bacterium]